MRKLIMLFVATLICVGLGLSLASGASAGTKCDPKKDPYCCDPKKEKCEPPKEGEPCSPGFYKNHIDFWWGEYCDETGDPSQCDLLLEALICKGSDASCGRSEAAGYLNDQSGCTED